MNTMPTKVSGRVGDPRGAGQPMLFMRQRHGSMCRRRAKSDGHQVEELHSGKGLAEQVVVLLVIRFGDGMRIRLAA